MNTRAHVRVGAAATALFLLLLAFTLVQRPAVAADPAVAPAATPSTEQQIPDFDRRGGRRFHGGGGGGGGFQPPEPVAPSMDGGLS